MFTLLGQETYLDENGRAVDAIAIEHIAPYRYKVDGFFEWQCGYCLRVYASRGVGSIAGQVLSCQYCQHRSLLVKTNTHEINNAISSKIQYEEQLQSLNLQRKQEIEEKGIYVSPWVLTQLIDKITDLNNTTAALKEVLRQLPVEFNHLKEICQKTNL